MDKLVKSLKTTKRRLSQQFKVVTGKAEVTADAEFDLAYRNFNDLENNLKALSSQCTALIHNVDTWCDTNRRLADELLRFTSKSILDTTDMKAYKQNPDSFKGSVADVSTVIRVAVTGRQNTPDLCTIMQLLGFDRTVCRIKNAIERI